VARIAAAAVAVAALAAAGVTERAAVAASFAVLGHLHWLWIPAAVLLEAASMAAFAIMLRRLLAAGGASVGVRPMLATAYAANALSVSVPLAGPELATAFTYRRFTRQGADAPLAGWSLLVGGVVSTAAGVLVVGGGPAEPRLRRLLPSAVFLGQHRGEQLAEIFASLDVFVHGGCHETFGQAIQEAAASGLPVVAPAVGGPVDLVEDGATGYLVPPGDAGALTAATRRLAADPAARAAMGRAGRQRVLARSWTALGDQLIGHYAAVLGERSAGELPGDQRDAVSPCDLLAGGQVGRA